MSKNVNRDVSVNPPIQVSFRKIRMFTPSLFMHAKVKASSYLAVFFVPVKSLPFRNRAPLTFTGHFPKLSNCKYLTNSELIQKAGDRPVITIRNMTDEIKTDNTKKNIKII